jgi:hypothetical protein
MDKPREVFVTDDMDEVMGRDTINGSNWTAGLAYIKKPDNDETTRFIEYSAYESLKEKLLTFEGMTFSENQEIIKLKEQNAILIEALKWQKDYIRNYCIFVHPLKNKDGLETDKHMISHIENALKKVGVE